MCLSSLFYRVGTENQMFWVERAHRQWPFCQGQPRSTEVSLERRTRNHMGSSAVTAPVGTKLWELPHCTKTCPRQSLVGPLPPPPHLQKDRGMAPCSSTHALRWLSP